MSANKTSASQLTCPSTCQPLFCLLFFQTSFHSLCIFHVFCLLSHSTSPHQLTDCPWVRGKQGMKRMGGKKEGETGLGGWRVRGGDEGRWIPWAVPRCPFLWKVSVYTFSFFSFLFSLHLNSWYFSSVACQWSLSIPGGFQQALVHFSQFYLIENPTPSPCFYVAWLHIYTPSSWHTGVKTDRNIHTQCTACINICTHTHLEANSACLSPEIKDIQFIFKHSIPRLQSMQLVFHQRGCTREWNREMKREMERKKRKIERQGNREHHMKDWPTRSIHNTIPHTLKAKLPRLMNMSVHPPVVFLSSQYCFFSIFMSFTHTHTHTHTHTLWSSSLPWGRPCGRRWQMQPSLYRTHITLPHFALNYTHYKNHSLVTSLSHTHTHTHTHTHSGTTCSTDGTFALQQPPLPFLAAPTNGASTQCFQHLILISNIPTSLSPGASLLTYYLLTDATFQHHSPQAMPRSTSPQPNPHPLLSECDRRTASWLDSTTRRIKEIPATQVCMEIGLTCLGMVHCPCCDTDRCS